MDMPKVKEAIDSVRSFYEEQGIFMKQFGFSERPAMVIIDMAYGWTDPGYATGSARLDDAVEGIQSLLPVARAKHIPIIYTTYPPPRGEEEPMHTTDGAKQQYRVWDAHACEIDHRLTPLPADLIIYKENASAFFNTPLITYLTERRIDTLIITGCSTSACVRATSTDARAYRFKAIVPRECVQDRAEAAHEWNLLDIDAKFGDVVSRDDVIAYLQNLPDQT